MKNICKYPVSILFTALIFAASVLAQSGGTYEIKQSVVSNGGGTSDGGTYSLTGTAAQSVAGTNSTTDPYGVRGGFWQEFLAPTVATVAVSGRVLTSENNGITKVTVTLTDAGGATRSALTSAFGYFSFDDVEAGQTYIISVRSKRYQFSNPTQVITLMDEFTDLTFTALPE
jgi:hypothetical protein